MLNHKGKKETETGENQTEAAQNEKVFTRIHKNYNDLNKMMVEEMDLSSEHDGLTGNYREEMWVKFFRSILPQKFSLAQGVMIIDSQGHVSKEVDIAVFDEQYTPYVFQYNTLKFIPIEAVALVVECKSASLPAKENLINWANSIDKLRTCPSGVARMVHGYTTGLTNPTQKKTRPIKILACLKQSVTEEPIKNLKEQLGDYFDFIIQKKLNNERVSCFELLVKYEHKSLGWWGKQLNEGVSKDIEDQKLALDLLDQRKYKDEAAKRKKMEERKGELQEERPELKIALKFSDKEDAFLLENKLQDLKIQDNPLLSLNLQLNQLLMLINNPMLFPHFAYAKTFNEIIAKAKEGAEGTPACES